MRRFLFLHNKRNTRFETEDFATLVMYGLCRMYKPQMKADKGSPSRGGHNKNPCISLRSSGFSNPSSRPRNPVAGRRGLRRGALAAAAVHAHRSRRHGVAELPVHTGTQTQIRCWNCCQSWSQSRLESDSESLTRRRRCASGQPE